MAWQAILGQWMVRPWLLLIAAGTLQITWVNAAAATLSVDIGAQQNTGLATLAWPQRIRPASDTAPPWATAAAPLVFRGMTVIDVARGRRLANQTIVIVRNRIRAMGPAAKIRLPRGAQVVDGRGKYLSPGLWDMHVHPRDFVDIAFPLYIAYGVTGVRDPGSGVPLATLGQLKQEIATGTRVGPRMVVAGPLVHGQRGDRDTVETQNTFGLNVGVRASTPEKARRIVDSLRAAGADFIKTYFLSPEMYFAVAAEARRIGIPFGGHGPYAGGGWGAGVGGLTLSDSGAKILDHEDWLLGDPCGERNPESLNVAKCAAAGRHFRRNGTWIVEDRMLPTGMGPYIFPAIGRDNLRYYPRSLMDSGLVNLAEAFTKAPNITHPYPKATADWVTEIRYSDSLVRLQYPNDSSSITAQFFRRREALVQLPVLAGTDVGPQVVLQVPGLSLHNALVIFALAGMTPLAALQAATINPARALGATDSLGTVQVGKVADLVLFDADPLEDIWNTTKIRAVVANGRYFDRAALDGLLAQAERIARQR